MTLNEIQTWLQQAVAEEIEATPETVSLDKPFAELGVESSSLLGISGDLEDFLGIEIDPTVVFEYPTIRKLSEHLHTL